MRENETPEEKQMIDDALHRGAILFQNLGTDSTKSEVKAAEVEERNILREVKPLNEDFISFLLRQSLHD